MSARHRPMSLGWRTKFSPARRGAGEFYSFGPRTAHTVVEISVKFIRKLQILCNFLIDRETLSDFRSRLRELSLDKRLQETSALRFRWRLKCIEIFFSATHLGGSAYVVDIPSVWPSVCLSVRLSVRTWVFSAPRPARDFNFFLNDSC